VNAIRSAPEEAETANAGEANLQGITRRERQILECLVEGLTDKEIAASLTISPCTVGNHLRNIYEKAGAANRGEAAH
jgi:DNA-binding CsgD family transcriptional regulator